MRSMGLALIAVAVLGCAEEVAVIGTADCGTWGSSFAYGSWHEGASAVSTYANGDIGFASSFSGELDLGGWTLRGEDGAFVTRLDACGHYQWGAALGAPATGGGSQPSRIFRSAIDAAGRTVAVGRFPASTHLGGEPLSEDGQDFVALLQLDEGGTVRFGRRLGDVSEVVARGVAVAPNGDIVVVGYFDGTVSLGGAEMTSTSFWDAFAVGYDPDGHHLWSASFGTGDSSDDVSFDDVRIGEGGDILIVGDVSGGIVDFGGGPLSPVDGVDGPGIARVDMVVLALAGDGTHRWSRRFGGSAVVRAGTMALRRTGNLLIAGELHSGSASFGGPEIATTIGSYLVELDAGGAHVASTVMTSVTINAIEPAASEEVVVAGHVNNSVDPPTIGDAAVLDEPFLAGIGPSFQLSWIIPLGPAVPLDVAVDEGGGLVVTGSVTSYDDVTVAGIPLTSNGHTVGFLLRLAP